MSFKHFLKGYELGLNEVTLYFNNNIGDVELKPITAAEIADYRNGYCYGFEIKQEEMEGLI